MLARTEQLTRDSRVGGRERLVGLVELARLVRDPGDVLAFAEEIGLDTNTAVYQLALAELAENEGDYPRAVALLEGCRRGLPEEDAELVGEHLSLLLDRMEELILQQSSQPSRRVLKDIQRPQARINGRPHIQLNGLEFYIDPACRKYHRTEQIVAAFSRDCSHYAQLRKRAYEQELESKPYSWVSRELKPFKITALEHRPSLEPPPLRFSTPNRPRRSKLSCSMPDKDSSFPSRGLVDSPELLREIFKKSPSFPSKNVTRIVAYSPEPRARRARLLRPVECIRKQEE